MPGGEPGGRRPGRIRPAHLVQTALGLGLLAGVVALAGPARVAALLGATDPLWYAAAAGVYAVVAVARGLRLALLAPLAPARAVRLGMAVQAAVQVVPARLGEVSLPVLLRREAGLPLAEGTGVLLTVRALDLAALGAWGGAAVALRWGLAQPSILAASVALVLPLILLPVAGAWADRMATRLLAPRGRIGRRWTRRIRRARAALDGLRRRPWRLAWALTLTLAAWGLLWVSVWLLLRAIAQPMPLDAVVMGAASATLLSLVPVNLLGSFGTMETGWTAAFVALGVPAATAAASGLTVHILSLLVTVVYGAAAFLTLGSPRPAKS